eukprot:TRINITY_DN1758_c0_g3_i1.p1 TRINITY_DN1758_c0_g3~~TRINITY_DN1758_c0_g3_i1.p1  ORF type:complete len:300 (-),score=83.57 TRINITY_DN1758_c0_g3_i1:516-1415(-)
MMFKGLLRMVPQMRAGLALRFMATRAGAEAAKEKVAEFKKVAEEPELGIDKTIRNLADLVGMKYYPCNDGIHIKEDAKVLLIDANGRQRGTVSFTTAKAEATSRELDLILKKRSEDVPVVQMTPYRSELLKAFYSERVKVMKSKMMGVRVEEKKMGEEITSMNVNREISADDLEVKINRIIQLITKKKTPVRITIEINKSSKIDKVKAKLLLRNIKGKLESISDLKETDLSEKTTPSMELDDDRDKRRKAIKRPRDDTEYFILDVSPKADRAELKDFEKELKSLQKVDEIIRQISKKRL